MQNKYKNILLNFSIFDAACIIKYTEFKGRKIHKRTLFPETSVRYPFGFGQTCRNRSNVSIRIDVQINKSMYARFASIILRTINYESAVPLCVFLVVLDFTSAIVIEMLAYLLQGRLAKFRARGRNIELQEADSTCEIYTCEADR